MGLGVGSGVGEGAGEGVGDGVAAGELASAAAGGALPPSQASSKQSIMMSRTIPAYFRRSISHPPIYAPVTDASVILKSISRLGAASS